MGAQFREDEAQNASLKQTLAHLMIASRCIRTPTIVARTANDQSERRAGISRSAGRGRKPVSKTQIAR